MLECFSTNATVAKIRSIHGKMFTKENYHDMLSRRSVPEVADYLAHSPRYKDCFREVDPNTIHRGFLEQLLRKNNFDSYVRLCKFQGLDKQPFYDFLIKRHEIECILSKINNINSGADDSYLSALPGYVIKHSKVKLLELSNAESYNGLLGLLKHTPYYKTLSRMPLLEDGTVDYTKCELLLRQEYFQGLWNEIKNNYSGSAKEELKKLIFGEIDALNIINAYRMKVFFGYSADEIKAHQIKYSFIGHKKLDTFYDCTDSDEMLSWLDKVYCSGKNTEFIETRIRSVRFKKLEQAIVSSQDAPVVLYAFVMLGEIEINDIVHIIEGIRYGLDPSVIENKLIVC